MPTNRLNQHWPAWRIPQQPWASDPPPAVSPFADADDSLDDLETDMARVEGVVMVEHTHGKLFLYYSSGNMGCGFTLCKPTIEVRAGDSLTWEEIGEIVLDCDTVDPKSHPEELARQEANARRIVALWNLADERGWTTAQIERGEV